MKSLVGSVLAAAHGRCRLALERVGSEPRVVASATVAAVVAKTIAGSAFPVGVSPCDLVAEVANSLRRKGSAFIFS